MIQSASGTFTILFTDIEGAPAAALDARRAHRAESWVAGGSTR